MAGASGFMRVVADLGPILAAKDRLHRCVNIQHPRLAEQTLPSRAQVIALPAARSDLIELLEVAPRAILTDDLAHAQHRRSDRVKAQGVDMGIAGGAHKMESKSEPRTSSWDGALGLVNPKGASLQKSTHRPPACRNWAKKTNWPRGVIGAVSSHWTW
jgi:hypothetical protein